MTAHLTQGEYARLSFRALKPDAAGARAARGADSTPPARAGYTNYYAKRADANQPQIVGLLRKLGFTVQLLHDVGKGVFDLLLSKRGLNILAEVKDGSKPPSGRKLTPAQARFHFSWQGMRCVLTNEGDCYVLARQVATILQQIKQAGIVLEVKGSPDAMYQPSLY